MSCSSATPTLLKADAWLFGDGPVHQSRRQQIVFGARGVTGVNLTVYGPSRGLHSGHYGNWAPNPVTLIANLVASMRNDDGRILIKHFYDDVAPIGAAERRAIAAIPSIDSALARRAFPRRHGSEECVAHGAHHASRAQPARHSRRQRERAELEHHSDRRDGVDRLSPRAEADAGARAPARRGTSQGAGLLRRRSHADAGRAAGARARREGGVGVGLRRVARADGRAALARHAARRAGRARRSRSSRCRCSAAACR